MNGGADIDILVVLSKFLVKRYGNRFGEPDFINLAIRNLAAIEDAYLKMPLCPKKKRLNLKEKH